MVLTEEQLISVVEHLIGVGIAHERAVAVAAEGIKALEDFSEVEDDSIKPIASDSMSQKRAWDLDDLMQCIAINNQYAGDNKWDKEIEKSFDILTQHPWKGKSNYPLERHADKHRDITLQ